MSKLVCCTKSPQAQIYDGSRVCDHDLDTHRCLCLVRGHLMTQCFIAFTIARASLHLSSWTKRIELSTKRERKLTPVPSSGFVVSRRVAGTPSCQSPRTRSLRTLVRCTSWVVTYSQTGAGELRPKTPRLRRCGYGVAWIFSDGGLLTLEGRAGSLHGKNQSVARVELLAAVEALRLCRSVTQQVFNWTDCMFVVNGSPEGDGEDTCTTLTCERNSGKLTTTWATQSCSTTSGEVTPPRQRLLRDSFHHWKRTENEAADKFGREGSSAEPPFHGVCCCNSQHRQSGATCPNQADRDEPDARPEQNQDGSPQG